MSRYQISIFYYLFMAFTDVIECDQFLMDRVKEVAQEVLFAELLIIIIILSARIHLKAGSPSFTKVFF